MNEKILLCDDEIHILNASKFKFQRAGYEVLTASDGEEAWPIIEREQPRLVVTDFQMPRLTGLELVQRMRAHEHSAHIPVVLLTAKGLELSSQEICQQYQISLVVHKPFSPRSLLETVEKLLASTPSRPRESNPAAAPSLCRET